jgi:uncharacterized caspase-like protein
VRPATAAEQKVALVIGNSAYPSSRLRNPVNDARAMADKLRALGFEVILRTDSNLREMTRSFSQFGQKLTPGSVSLFYYAGHGMQVRGKNFLIPIDAEIENEASVSSEAVDVDQLLNQLGPARLSMVILDACRNNPFERRFRATASGGLAQIDAPTGTLLAYATAPGKVAADGTGVNGLYTTELLKAIDTPGLRIEDVFKQVRINVLKSSDNMQIPWESSSLTGEFFFRPGSRAEIENAQLRQSEKERGELTKTLEDERRRRDKDADLVRAEMEKLRAELQKIRAEAAKPAPPTEIAALTTSPATKPMPDTALEKPAQLAIASPLPGNATTASDEWAQRIALLEKYRSQLTFAKAIALLFDITRTENLVQMALLEKLVQESGWANALAIGIDGQGKATWAGAAKFRSTTFAIESALDPCNKTAGGTCKIVFLNGIFQEKNFLEWAQRLNGRDMTQWRESFLKSVAVSPTEIITTGGITNVSSGNTVASARIFTPSQQ